MYVGVDGSKNFQKIETVNMTYLQLSITFQFTFFGYNIFVNAIYSLKIEKLNWLFIFIAILFTYLILLF